MMLVRFIFISCFATHKHTAMVASGSSKVGSEVPVSKLEKNSEILDSFK